MRAALRVAPSRPKPFEVWAGCPHFQRLDVKKPRYRGGCAVVIRCFEAPALGQGAGGTGWRAVQSATACYHSLGA